MNTAAAYIRVSTDEQLEYSPDSQLKTIKSYAEKNGFVLPEEYIFLEEEGRSGRNSSKRPEFMRMIATAKQTPKPFDAILVWKYSRFARNRQDSIVYKSMLRKELNIEVVSVSEYIGDDKMSIITEAVIEAMDEFYSVNLAEEVTRGMSEKAVRGEPLTYAPFGYIMENRQYLPDPKTAPIVRMIFTDFLGGMGYRDIAGKLNAIGVRTRFGNRMESRSIRYILQNPVYAGKIHWNPNGRSGRYALAKEQIISEGHHQPLVSQEEFDAAGQRIAELKSLYSCKAKSVVKPKNEYALRGLVRCSNCNSTLVINSRCGKSKPYIQCNAYNRGRCDTSHAMGLTKMTQWVISTIQADMENQTFELNRRKAPAAVDHASIIRSQLQREKQKLRRIREAFESGVDTLEEYSRSKEKLLSSINRLSEQLIQYSAVSDRPQIPSVSVCPLVPTLVSADTAEQHKNLILRTFVEKIVFDRQNNIIEVYYYCDDD